MFTWLSFVLALSTLNTFSHAATIEKRAAQVKIDNATIVGLGPGLLGPPVNQYLGIPFGKPTSGARRFALPEAVDPYTGTIRATQHGLACYQQGAQGGANVPAPKTGNATLDKALKKVLDDPKYGFRPAPNAVGTSAAKDPEDCLNLNVVTPSNVTPDSKLPVVVWIYGGGFEFGSPFLYPGSTIVADSIKAKTPIIHVAMQYRLNGFGFLASKEVRDAGVGNLGLQDQRLALHWVQKYISAFGGDPTKVTIWGESAGAISVALHMVTNGGDNEGLFRGGFMQSGSPIPVGPIEHGQGYYNQIVNEVGCATAVDTLGCLRTVNFKLLAQAIDRTPSITSYQALNLTWIPRVDGKFLVEPPFESVQKQKFARIPFVNGDCDDEGTLFTILLSNITTPDQAEHYLQTNYAPESTPEEVDQVRALYVGPPSAGSPFDTGNFNQLTPVYKQLAAFQGDLVFHGPRRWFFQHAAPLQKAWSYVYKKGKTTPLLSVLGTFHASDILNSYGSGGELERAVISFTATQDPNYKGIPVQWPTYDVADPKVLIIRDDLFKPVILGNDTFRKEGMDTLNALALKYPL